MSKMTKEERELYHSDVKAKSDWNAGIRYADKKGRLEIAIKLKAKAMSIDEITEITGLAIEEIENL